MGKNNADARNAQTAGTRPASMRAMSILSFLRGALHRRSEKVETWSTPKLTEIMVLLHQQLHHPSLTGRQRADIEDELARITREIEKRRLGS